MSTEHHVPLLGITCREASRLISESLDRELTRRERWSLRVHTLLCTACRAFARHSRALRDVIASAPSSLREQLSTGGASLSPERRAEIKRLLTDARRADPQD